jgi:hypothetical protein
MIIISFKFDLKIPSFEKKTQIRKKGAVISNSRIALISAVVLLLGILGFYLTLPYQNTIYAPWTGFQNRTVNAGDVFSLAYGSSKIAGLNASLSGYSTSWDLITLQDGSSSNIIVIAQPEVLPKISKISINYTSSSNKRSIILKNGIVMNSEIVDEGDHNFSINVFVLPYNLTNNQGWMSVSYAAFKYLNNTNVSGDQCTITPLEVGIPNYFESIVLNTLRGQSSGNMKFNCASYFIASSANG